MEKTWFEKAKEDIKKLETKGWKKYLSELILFATKNYPPKIIIPIENIHSPPCTLCKYWLPRVGDIYAGEDGEMCIILCWAKNQEPDFSCFEERKNDSHTS